MRWHFSLNWNVFSCKSTYQKSQSALFILPEKGFPSAAVGTVRRWCQDYAAWLKESFTGKVPRLQKFCRHNYWVFVASCKSKHQLTTESAECCQTRDGCRRPSIEAPAWAVTGEQGMPFWTRVCYWWSSRNIGKIWSLHCVPLISHAVTFCTDLSAVECLAARRAAKCNSPTSRK